MRCSMSMPLLYKVSPLAVRLFGEGSARKKFDARRAFIEPKGRSYSPLSECRHLPSKRDGLQKLRRSRIPYFCFRLCSSRKASVNSQATRRMIAKGMETIIR